MHYQRLVHLYLALEKTTKRLEKTALLAAFLKEVPKDEVQDVVYLLQGLVFPPWDERKIGFSSRLMLKAISVASGASADSVEKLWSKKGDLGIVATELLGKKTQKTLTSEHLTVKKVIDNIRKLATLEGAGTVDRKIALVAELLTSSSPEEARFIARTVLEELRVGIAAGILRDSIAQATGYSVEEIEQSADILADYGEVAHLAKEKKLKTVILVPGRPMHVMLSIPVKDVAESFEELGKPAQFEYKLDGVRLQIHKNKNHILLFTRRMENVTKQFPEVVEYAKTYVKGKSFIIDCEAVGFDPKTGVHQPFQSISQRIKRKYDIEQLAKKLPVEVNVFDIMYCNGKTMVNKPLKERRALLEKILKNIPHKIKTTEKLVTDDIKKAQHFYDESLAKGNEGLMIKKIDALYRPGRYVGGWCKLKPVLEPLDVVIVGASYGEGKRAATLSSYVIACQDEDGNLLEVGRVSTGVKEKEEEGVTFDALTKLLKPLITETKGRDVVVKPKIVVEVAYEEVQKSPTYKSGYALRFPRFKRLRLEEKKVGDINTLADVERIYKVQKGKKAAT
ncbi:ATP-dependent DNA ligase [Candidatus Woesearchaeota archaeon]|nr:ATP-dependent DNA ligase [Candidatus Woesearchaeota archaeon]